MIHLPATLPALPSFVASSARYARAWGVRESANVAAQLVSAMWQLRGTRHGAGIRVRGKVWVRNAGTLELGRRLRIDGTAVRTELVTFPGGRLAIGDSTYINYGTNISATQSVEIGAGCAIGQYCIIMDNDYHIPGHLEAMPPANPVRIGNGVWLGARVVVLPGSNIGDGSVIGANSVVKGCIPPGVIAAGMPARVLRSVAEEAGGE
jgi:acetyltransferase-like isoleucine patch superfamily enzyme